MSYKLLWIPTTLFASALTFAVACEPCEGDECDFGDGGGAGGGSATGGQGGATGTGGKTSSGGASTGGAAPTGGAGGMGGDAAEPLDCLESGEPEGTPGSCEPIADESDPSYACQACAAEYCCAEVEACSAEDPLTACYYGSTARLGFDGEPIVGELDCILDCLREIPDDEFVGDDYEIDACASECGSAECNEDYAGDAATALVACLVGIGNDVAPAGCQTECAILDE